MYDDHKVIDLIRKISNDKDTRLFSESMQIEFADTEGDDIKEIPAEVVKEALMRQSDVIATEAGLIHSILILAVKNTVAKFDLSDEINDHIFDTCSDIMQEHFSSDSSRGAIAEHMLAATSIIVQDFESELIKRMDKEDFDKAADLIKSKENGLNDLLDKFGIIPPDES